MIGIWETTWKCTIHGICIDKKKEKKNDKKLHDYALLINKARKFTRLKMQSRRVKETV